MFLGQKHSVNSAPMGSLLRNDQGRGAQFKNLMYDQVDG